MWTWFSVCFQKTDCIFVPWLHICPFTSPHDTRVVSILSAVYSLISAEHTDTQYSRFLYGRHDSKPLKIPPDLLIWPYDFMNQWPASHFVLNLLFLKILRLVADQAMHYGQCHSIKQLVHKVICSKLSKSGGTFALTVLNHVCHKETLIEVLSKYTL